MEAFEEFLKVDSESWNGLEGWNLLKIRYAASPMITDKTTAAAMSKSNLILFLDLSAIMSLESAGKFPIGLISD